MGSPPRLARQPTQLTICSSAGSRQAHRHPGTCPGSSGGPVRLCPAPLSELSTAESTLASSVGLTPTKLRSRRELTTMLRELTDTAARADYSALKLPLHARPRCLLRCPRPATSRPNLHCAAETGCRSAFHLDHLTCEQLSPARAASSQAVRV